MSLHISLLLLEGNHLSHISQVFEMFGYQDSRDDKQVQGWEALKILDNWQISDTEVLKAVCLCQNWSVIVDPEMVMFADEEACAKVSSEFQIRIFGTICEGVSATYGFNFFQGQKVRGFLSVDGEIIEDVGDPLAGESLFDKRQVFEDEILRVMGETAIQYDDVLNDTQSFVIKKLIE
jgi:hypothetical protein